MKAAILVESKKPLIVDNVQLPDKLEFGQVLVKVIYSGICGAQINEIDAVKGPDKFLPHLLGHEGSGIVEGVGKGVSRVKIGDKVVLHWRPSQGIQSTTASYIWKEKKLILDGLLLLMKKQLFQRIGLRQSLKILICV